MNDTTVPPAGTPVSLREITADTVRAITKLTVSTEQGSYVASNAVSLAQALFAPSAWYRAIYAGDSPVGFVMVEDQTLLQGAERPAQPSIGLWRFMIDQRCQGRGFGRAALLLVIEHFRQRPGITEFLTSCMPGPLSPKGFYESLGFIDHGEFDEDEMVLRLPLPPAACPAGDVGSSANKDRARELHERLIRNFKDIATHREVREPLYDSIGARLATGTAAQKLGATVDTVPPGKRSCPYHLHHAQEEMFIVLDGRGTLRVAGEMLPLRAGDVAFIPPGPDYPHQLLNTSDAPLTYLSISTRDTPEIVEYPDSGKYLVMAGPPGARTFDTLQRQADSLDYWDGEP